MSPPESVPGSAQGPVPCAAHPDSPAVARCKLCSARLCDSCFAFVRADSDPLCARCAAYLAAGGNWSTLRIASFVLATGSMLGGGVLGYAKESVGLGVGVGGAGVAIAVALTLLRASGAVEAGAAHVRPRTEHDALPPSAMVPAAHPFRARFGRAAVRAVPMLSGRVTALSVLGAFVVAASVLPLALKLPAWVEVELVVSALFLLLWGTLAGLLYSGYRLREDHAIVLPWGGSAATRPAAKNGGSSPGKGCDPGCSGCGDVPVDAEGCGVIVVIALALGAALALSWLVLELLVPIVFYAAYELLVRSIGRVANDRHGCEGSLARSLGWGGLWAGIYTVPLALVVFAVHLVLARR